MTEHLLYAYVQHTFTEQTQIQFAFDNQEMTEDEAIEYNTVYLEQICIELKDESYDAIELEQVLDSQIKATEISSRGKMVISFTEEILIPPGILQLDLRTGPTHQ